MYPISFGANFVVSVLVCVIEQQYNRHANHTCSGIVINITPPSKKTSSKHYAFFILLSRGKRNRASYMYIVDGRLMIHMTGVALLIKLCSIRLEKYVRLGLSFLLYPLSLEEASFSLELRIMRRYFSWRAMPGFRAAVSSLRSCFIVAFMHDVDLSKALIDFHGYCLRMSLLLISLCSISQGLLYKDNTIYNSVFLF